ncbi:alkaline phosphatase [Grosmannia clavigera kw1407]|uniref:Alkaline phosphatase n=1 Tax=Grosmannia clavigera (strain kw1407 / UAMH 11150) TaxID=655863 RepID=F0XIX5_GROCL|nr:alkaline phosphatase [Grosmannia clavigera kw1407]EFX02263.1 alkaline phosphatase [Grosmannia clavigera kw1407]
MTSARTPLLVGARHSGESDRSDDLAEAEDAALHTSTRRTEGQWPPRGAASTSGRLRELLLFAWALLATAAAIILVVWTRHQQQTTPRSAQPALLAGKRNLIFMVSDGMGPASLSLTRSFRQLTEGVPINDTLALDRHFWGTSRTRSSNSLVTDSAAGATAFSCGKKSYNGAISILPDLTPCGTVLEAAKRAGYHTGLVVTTDITDATPACFASHVNVRTQMDEIALQEIGEGPLGHVVDLMLGGGRCHFLPNTSQGSCRQDNIDVTSIAELNGWHYVDDRAGFDSLETGNSVSLPVLGLFASADIPFEIDRRNMADTYPSLSEMAATALRALEKATEDSEKGFFLMIEGSRIDHAGHINDPAAQVREVMEFDKTFRLVLDFLEQSDTEGIVVSTSDHETGGLSTALQEPGHLPIYNWYPTALDKAKVSSEHLSLLLREHVLSIAADGSVEDVQSLKNWINMELLIPHLGITDALDEELELLASNPETSIIIFAELVSLRAHIGWSTHGHSAVDVNIYSSGGPVVEGLRGNVENTDVGKFLREYLDVDVEKITQELNSKLGVDQSSASKTSTAEDLDFPWSFCGLPPNAC